MLLFPEIAFDEAKFVAIVDAKVTRFGYCCVGVSEGLKNADGQLMAEAGTKDAFGHAQLGGVGPLIAERQRDRVEGYIAKGLAEGARITVGGGRPADFDTGWFVEPTVFADVTNNMTIAREEIFGPVLSVIAYENEADALRITELPGDAPTALVANLPNDPPFSAAPKAICAR